MNAYAVVIILILMNCAVRQGSNLHGINSRDLSSKINFSGGNGESPEEAIKITGVEKQSEGLAAEYQYISKIYGEKGKMWSIAGQVILKEKNKVIDVLEIRLNTPEKDLRIYYFDVTSFPWKKDY